MIYHIIRLGWINVAAAAAAAAKADCSWRCCSCPVHFSSIRRRVRFRCCCLFPWAACEIYTPEECCFASRCAGRFLGMLMPLAAPLWRHRQHRIKQYTRYIRLLKLLQQNRSIAYRAEPARAQDLPFQSTPSNRALQDGCTLVQESNRSTTTQNGALGSPCCCCCCRCV